MSNAPPQNGSMEALQAQLHDPQTLAALTRILERIDSLEKTVMALADAVEQAPVMMAVTTDAVDDAMSRLQDQGVDVDERLRNALQLAEKMTEPQTVAALSSLLERVDKLEQAVVMADQAPDMMAFVTDTVDETMLKLQAEGVDVDERLRNGLELLLKVSEPKTVAAIELLLARIDMLEQGLTMADQAPDMMAFVTDTVDETMLKLQAEGVDVDERLRNGLELLLKVSEPKTVAAIEQLLARIDMLEQGLTMADQAPDMMAFVTDTVDETMLKLQAEGVDVDERLRSGLNLLLRVSEPKTVAVMEQLLDRIDRIEPMLKMADQAPDMVAFAVDSFDEAYFGLLNAGIDVERLIAQSLTVAGKVTAIIDSEEFDALMESGALDPQAVQVIGMAGNALVESRAEVKPLGFFGMLKAMRDRDTQRAMGFLMSFARNFGRIINQQSS